MALSTACPKIKPGELTRAERKQQAQAKEVAELRACYAKVDVRDGNRCRICGRRVSPQAKTLLHKTIRHHLIFRAHLSDPHRSENVITIDWQCNDAIHTKGTMHVEGNADQKDPFSGKLNGVAVYKIENQRWKLDGWR